MPIPNFRDVGGFATPTGHISHGILFRSAAIVDFDQATAEQFAQHQIGTVFDLRTSGERDKAGDVLPAHIALEVLDVLGSDPTSAAASLAALISHPESAKTLTAAGAEALLEGSYRAFVTLPSASVAYRGVFARLSAPSESAYVMHCTAGKDRTGWAAAALQLWLGVDEATVFSEYLRSNHMPAEQLESLVEFVNASGGDGEAIRALVSAKPAYLEAAIGEVHAHFSGFQDYFTRGLGLGVGDQTALRNRFLPS